MPGKNPQQWLEAYNDLCEQIIALEKNSTDVMKFMGLKLMAEGTLESLRAAIAEEALSSGKEISCNASDGRRYYSYRKTHVTYDTARIKREKPKLYQQALDFSPTKAKEIPGLNIYASIDTTVVVSSNPLIEKDDPKEGSGAGENN